ncbi:MAG: hypothetical protein J6Q18_02780, partial [Oscillospiraceae bacterium]|nr:hypothetical protein [Oscillospiraceae bacterium]
KTELPQHVQAPVESGMRIGSLSLYTSRGKIREYPVIIGCTVEKIDFGKALAILTKNIGQL